MNIEPDKIKYAATLTIVIDGVSKTFDITGDAPKVPGARSVVRGAIRGLGMVTDEYVNDLLD